jgi:gamma-glutamylcysteine synthetase
MVLALPKTELVRDAYAAAVGQRYVHEVNRQRVEILAEQLQHRKELHKAQQELDNLLAVLKRHVATGKSPADVVSAGL